MDNITGKRIVLGCEESALSGLESLRDDLEECFYSLNFYNLDATTILDIIRKDVISEINEYIESKAKIVEAQRKAVEETE